MSTIDPSLLNSIFSVTYSYAPDPGDTVSYTRAKINIQNIDSLNVNKLTYTTIDFGDASGNLFVGDAAGCNATLASNCTGLGEQSMDYLTKGSNVTSVGFSSLRNTASLTRVVALGTYAGDSNSNVVDTVLVGDSAARNLSGASSNVIIGSGAGASLTGGNNNILIGAGVDPVVGSNNNVFNIGNTLSGTVGGSIVTASNLAVRGTLSSGTINAYSFLSSPVAVAWNTSGGQGSGLGQSYTMFLVDTLSSGFGANSRQMMTYVYPATGTSSRGGIVLSYRILLSDQAVSGLSAGDIYVDNTLAAGFLATNNLSVGGTVSATEFVGNGSIPIGGIIMWSGSVASIPAGWALCDGTNGTPNLTNQFVIGAGGAYAVGSNGGSTTILAGNLPKHGHTLSDPTHAHGYNFATTTTDGYAAAHNNQGTWGGLQSALTTSNATGITVSTSALLLDSNGSPVTQQPYLPPFYALAYIMRTA